MVASLLTRLVNDGFVFAGEFRIGAYLQRHPEFYPFISRFNSGTRYKHSTGHFYVTATELFGKRLVLWYDNTHPTKMVRFLTTKFLLKNPSPSPVLRSCFTKLLHNHNLCWYGCEHSRGDKPFSLYAQERNGDLVGVNPE